MLKETFYIDGVDARSVGISLQRPVEFSKPVPVVKTEKIPGKNGNAFFDEGNYENRTATASCFSLDAENVLPNIREINKFLFSGGSRYRRLETSDDPDYFWMARVENGARTEQRMRHLAPFDISFDCKPQKFAKSGENAISVQNGSVVYNYYGFDALPIVRVRVRGTSENVTIRENIRLTIGEATVYFKPKWWSYESLEQALSPYNRNLSEILEKLFALGINKKEFGIAIDKCLTIEPSTDVRRIDVEIFWSYLTDFANEGTTKDQIIDVFSLGYPNTSDRVAAILRSMILKEKANTIVLDSDTLSAYNEMSSQDHNVIAPKFPVLKPGENVISWDKNVVSVEIVPRWWCL